MITPLNPESTIMGVLFIALDLTYVVEVGPLLATLVFIIIAIELEDLVKAAIALGISSAILAAVFFTLNAPYAEVFELSVAAGLITILLLSAIGLIERTSKKETTEETK
jgi:NADH:ubiquinone oxidoreductase subunit 6 (subunit J)